MNGRTAWMTDRLSDPSVCSVIFAPRAENYTLTSATTPMRFADAINFESLVEQNELVKLRLLRNMERAAPELQILIAEYLGDYLETSFTTLTLKLPSDIVHRELERIPGRSFPFASHLNLVGPPAEGLSFDLDDFLKE